MNEHSSHISPFVIQAAVCLLIAIKFRRVLNFKLFSVALFFLAIGVHLFPLKLSLMQGHQMASGDKNQHMCCQVLATNLLPVFDLPSVEINLIHWGSGAYLKPFYTDYRERTRDPPDIVFSQVFNKFV